MDPLWPTACGQLCSRLDPSVMFRDTFRWCTGCCCKLRQDPQPFWAPFRRSFFWGSDWKARRMTLHGTTSHTPPLKKVRLNVPSSNWLYKKKVTAFNNPLPCTYHSANHLRLRFGWRTRRPQKHLTIALQACQHQLILWNKNIPQMSVLWGILFSNRNCKQIASPTNMSAFSGFSG